MRLTQFRLRYRFSWPLACALAAGCGGKPAPSAPPQHVSFSRQVFEAAAPSVVAILNDDRADREEEAKALLKSMGDETRAPKQVIDVSTHKEPMPHGTGFLIDGGLVLTAAHVVMRPDRLKIITRGGKMVDADLVRIDEIRDVAILKPRGPLEGVVPIELASSDVHVGDPVWAMGHTGQGLWALSWGVSEGVASGLVDAFGVQLLLFDAAVYPGFSGGPVLGRGPEGKPVVVGVNHALLFTGGFLPTPAISSAVSASEVREVLAAHAHPAEAKLVAYAKEQNAKQYADLFVTQGLSISRDAHGVGQAEIVGNAREVEATEEGGATVPVVAMMFRLPQGSNNVEFDLYDPNGQIVSTSTKTVNIADRQRVSFVSAGFHFNPKAAGRYEIRARIGSTLLGSATVAIAFGDDDNELVETHDADVSNDGTPDVDVVVAGSGNYEPLVLRNINATWAAKSYPRRMEFTWFARGTRGWAGTNTVINTYVLDQAGHVVGRSYGCFRPQLRPETPWSCLGSGGTPLAMREGLYDVVFTIGDRPVAMWPMEATIRADDAPGNDLERFLREVKRRSSVIRAPKPPPPPPPAAPPGKGPKKPGSRAAKPPKAGPQ